MKKIITPFRVGLLVLASGVFLFAFLSFSRKGGLSGDEALPVYAYFNDASGLGKKSRVQIAGIPVGEISDIQLEGTRAKVLLRIRREVPLRQNATLKKRSESLLGDYMLDLTPGTQDSPAMPENGQIIIVQDTQGMEQLMDSLKVISADVQQVTGSLRRVLGGDKGAQNLQQIVDNMVSVSKGVDDTVKRSSDQLDQILANVRTITHDVQGLEQKNQQKVNEIVSNVETITKDTKDVLATVKKIVGSAEGGDVQESVASLKRTLERLDHTLANLEDVTTKVKEGKGTVGALLADERMGQKLSETVEDISDYANRLTGIKAEVSIRSEYQLNAGAAKNTVGLRLAPKPDKYYLLELVDDSRGTIDTITIQNNPPGAGQPVTQVQRITSDKLKFSAQFAKRYYFLTLRFGLLESTGGIGADLHFLNDALTFKVDAFNFSVQELRFPRLRATLRLQAFEHLFATVGMDDMLNTPVRDDYTRQLIAGRDFFVGAGVYFTDDDLKSILPLVPVPK